MSQLFLLARLDGRRVAIGAEGIESVVDIAAVTPVPRVPRHVRGLAALRSRVVTVIDTRLALDGDAAVTDGPMRAVIVRVDGHHYALLVDEVEDVAPFELRPLDPGIALSRAWAHAARGVVEQGGEPVLALDAAALLPVAA